MALETASQTTSPTAKVIGNAFVEQYYHILHHSPESVYRFYQDSSVISRPGSDGIMTSVTTMQDINEKILSFDYKEYKAEIKTADAQKSYKDGVTVLVTGCLTDKDNLKRKFAQSFFLAPQDNGGFFVLNDVFRYVDDGELLINHPIKEVDDVVNSKPSRVPDPPAPDQVNGNKILDTDLVEDSYEASNRETQLANRESTAIDPPAHSHNNNVPVESKSISSETFDDGPKTYASIVKVAKGSSMGNNVYVPTTNNVKAASKKTETQSLGPATSVPSPETLAPSNTSMLESNNDNEEVEEGHSIYIRNLPFSMTTDQLETEFKKFGPIKQGGIQVRNNRQQGYCFGFVEFESVSSMDNAIKASPINIRGRQAVVEIKRTNTRVGGGHGRGARILMERSEGFRGRGGNYVTFGGRSFGRNEYSNRSEFTGRGRGLVGRGRTARPTGPIYNVALGSA